MGPLTMHRTSQVKLARRSLEEQLGELKAEFESLRKGNEKNLKKMNGAEILKKAKEAVREPLNPILPHREIIEKRQDVIPLLEKMEGVLQGAEVMVKDFSAGDFPAKAVDELRRTLPALVKAEEEQKAAPTTKKVRNKKP
jgi:hypothetical protein